MDTYQGIVGRKPTDPVSWSTKSTLNPVPHRRPEYDIRKEKVVDEISTTILKQFSYKIDGKPPSGGAYKSMGVRLGNELNTAICIDLPLEILLKWRGEAVIGSWRDESSVTAAR
jgi:hypothetical protein